jgi:hypothetical protein
VDKDLIVSLLESGDAALPLAIKHTMPNQRTKDMSAVAMPMEDGHIART